MSPAPARIVRVVADVQEHLLSRARLAVGVWLGGGVTGALILAWLVVAPEGWRQGTAMPLAIDLALASFGMVAWAAYRKMGTLWLREPNLTASMEESAGLAPGVLQGSLELARALPGGVSSALAVQAAEEALADLKGPRPRLAGRMAGEATGWIRRGTLGLVLLVPTVAVLTMISPTRSYAAWAGLARPFGLLSGPTLAPLEVTPGSTEVLRGSDVPLTVTAPGRLSVTVHWQAAGDVAVEERLDVIADQAGLVLRTVSARTEYWVEAPDGARSPSYELQPIDPLLVSDVTVSLTFPPHTGRFPEEYGADTPALDIPAGSRFSIQGRASRPLSSAGLDGPQGEEVRFEVSGQDFEGDWRPRASGVYPWHFTDTEGDPAEVAPPPLELLLVPDSAPDVAVLVPGKDTLLPVSLRQPLVLQAADDYGLDRLELVVYRVTAFGDRLEPVVSPMPVGGTRGALMRPVIDLTRWELLPGDTIRYLVRAVDNAPSPNVSETPEYVLRPPTPADLRREAQERLDDVARGVEELAQRADEQAQEVQALERQLDNPPEPERSPLNTPADEARERLDFEEQEDIRGALEDQEALLSAIDSLEMELGQLDRDLEAAGLGDPELQKKLEELQRLMDELAPDSMQERLEELSKRLENMNSNEADQTLEELAADQEALRDRLEAALEALKRAAMEQDFRATAAEAEELAQQEEALADAMAEGDDPELRGDQQEALEQQAEDLQERLDRLQERLEEAGEDAARDAVEQASQQGEQAQQSMAEAQEQSRMGQTQQASESAQEAAESMNQMSQQLQQAQQEMAEQMMQAMQEAMQETATDALTMAREQTDLREQMRGAGREERANMRGDQAALLQGVRNMADNLSTQDRMGQGEERDVAGQIGQAMQAMEQTLAALDDQRGRTPSSLNAAEQAVGALNQVALAAMAAAQQAGQMGQSQSAQQMMEQMEQLAQQQGSINSQTGQLTPMQLGEQAMAQQLQDAAQRQEDVAEELQDIAQRPSAQDDALGDLEAMALEAMELADRLAGNRLDAETLRRQEELFHRMLDAGRSLEKDEFSEERESTAAGEFERESVDALSTEDMGELRFQLPPAETLRRLSPAQRQMVLDYFERLNRAERRSPGRIP